MVKSSKTGINIGMFFVALWVVLVYLAILRANFLDKDPKVYRQQVIISRCAMFLPIYSLLMWICFVSPYSLPALLIVIVVEEAISFYNFAALIVYNMGGSGNLVNTMKTDNKDLRCFQFCLPEDKTALFKRVSWAVWIFCVPRIVVQILAAFSAYAGTNSGDTFYRIFTVINSLLLLYGLVNFVTLYENVLTYNKNIHGVLKLLLIKISVGIITIGGLITGFEESNADDNFNDDSDYNPVQKLIRQYCLVILFLFACLSPFYYRAFCGKVTPNITGTIQEIDVSNVSVAGFIVSTLNVFDTVGALTYYDSDEPKAPLNAA